MAGELLLDTGALVSLLDRSQPQHGECVKAFDGWQGPVLSTEAVLTEATHLLGRVPAAVKRVWTSFSVAGRHWFRPPCRRSVDAGS